MLGRFSSRTRNPNSIDINQRPYSPSPPKPAIIKINQKPKVINKLLYRKIIEYLTISGILVIIKEKLGKMPGCYRKTIPPETHITGHHDRFIAKKLLREQG